jgi:phospholipase C
MADIEHVIVLALENRSFDHMLGYLDHPKPDEFDGLSKGGHTNPGWSGGLVPTQDKAKRVLPIDPDHSHDAVLEQLAVVDGRPTNQGFVTSYERKGRELSRPRFEGLLGPVGNGSGRLIHWVKGLFGSAKVENRGPLIMLCHTPEQVPVLSELARSFAVCTRWFCSVPGETWPNRHFMHAATSDGETDINLRPYDDRTIFDLLEDNEKTWHVYHDDTPQIWAFPHLWDSPGRHGRWFPVEDFAEHVAAGRLPNYSFIEPNHRVPLHTLDHAPLIGEPSVSDSQHPGNNLVDNDRYDDFPDNVDADFDRAEALVARIYEALRTNPQVFERSLLLITYDEHGGFYDHVPPPTDAPHPGDPRSGLAEALRVLWRKKSRAFDFRMLGPRVPAIVISPYVPHGTVDAETHEHAAIPATLRAIFAPDAKPLTKRDEWAKPFHTALTLDEPRRTDLPNLSTYTGAPRVTAGQGTPVAAAGSPTHPARDTDFAAQAKLVQKRLAKVAEPEVAGLPRTIITTPTVEQAADVTRAFMEAARRHREELGT